MYDILIFDNQHSQINMQVNLRTKFIFLTLIALAFFTSCVSSDNGYYCVDLTFKNGSQTRDIQGKILILDEQIINIESNNSIINLENESAYLFSKDGRLYVADFELNGQKCSIHLNDTHRIEAGSSCDSYFSKQ